tara:strand:+ start:459 stop:659 length:201 start_codon:yes stop_codon:yes gene_type:complete
MATHQTYVNQDQGIMVRSADDWRNAGKFTGIVSCAITGNVLKSVENVTTEEAAFSKAKDLAKTLHI